VFSVNPLKKITLATIFSRIVTGEIPCYKIAETADYLAFLDVRPQTKGHTLCIPKQETDYIFDLSDESLAGLMLFAKKVGRAIEQVVSCKRIGIAVIGLEVPHTHVHLIPIQSMEDMRFNGHFQAPAPTEMQRLAAVIAQKLQD
jgi:histidine triad (HIT) family protein